VPSTSENAARRLAGPEGDGYTRGAPMAGQSDPDLWKGMSAGWQVTAYLLAGLLTWGGIGYLVDRLARTGRAFTALGMVVGAVAGIYLVYLRFGRSDDRKP
jgi:ATP synthase protein I